MNTREDRNNEQWEETDSLTVIYMNLLSLPLIQRKTMLPADGSTAGFIQLGVSVAQVLQIAFAS